MFNERTLDALDWDGLYQQLDQDGCAIIRSLLSVEACHDISALYANPEPFRSQVIMARHGFGRGEYKYFRYPLPDLVCRMRALPATGADCQSLARADGLADPFSATARSVP